MNIQEITHFPDVREFWFDVDGVMTPSNIVDFYAAQTEEGLPFLEQRNGVEWCQYHLRNSVGELHPTVHGYIARYVGVSVFEGYTFNTKDGKAIELLRERGYSVFFISGRNSACVRVRAEALDAIPFLGVKDKLSCIKKHSDAGLGHILFVGDGIQDCDVLRVAALGVAPADAAPEAKDAAKAHTHAKGGEGVIYEIVSHFLKQKNQWVT